MHLRRNGDYEDGDARTKPKWMPQNGKYKLCDCKICFFCKMGLCMRITHGNLTANPIVIPCSPELHEIQDSPPDCAMCRVIYKCLHPNMKRDNHHKIPGYNVVCNGCPACQTMVCQKHWYDFHKKNAKVLSNVNS